MLTINYYKKNIITSVITVDFHEKKVQVENRTDRIFDTAFGKKTHPTMEEFYRFLETRCFSRDRADCKKLLRELEVDFYDPLEICEKTHGRMEEDFYHMDFIWDDKDISVPMYGMMKTTGQENDISSEISL